MARKTTMLAPLPLPLSLSLSLFLSLALLACFSTPAAALPPRAIAGPITFTFDVTFFTEDGYMLNLNSYNGEARCRKVVGAALSMTFPLGQFIWALTEGGVVQNPGDCSKVYPAGGGTPYSCIRSPTIVDTRKTTAAGTPTLMPPKLGCKAQACPNLDNPIKMLVGNATNTAIGFQWPTAYQLQGYSCSAPVNVPALATTCAFKSKLSWMVTCSPIQKRLLPAP